MRNLSLPTVPNPLPRRASVPLKFLTLSTVASVAWFLALVEISGADALFSDPNLMKLLAAASLSGLPAAWVYFQFPDRPVDIFHRFGMGAGLFIAVNVTISLTSIALHMRDILGMWTPILWAFLSYWVIASMYVPGPYLATLIAARWSR